MDRSEFYVVAAVITLVGVEVDPQFAGRFIDILGKCAEMLAVERDSERTEEIRFLVMTTLHQLERMLNSDPSLAERIQGREMDLRAISGLLHSVGSRYSRQFGGDANRVLILVRKVGELDRGPSL